MESNFRLAVFGLIVGASAISYTYGYNSNRTTERVVEKETVYVYVEKEQSSDFINNFSEECVLTDDQLKYIQFSYRYGEPYDLGYTLAAIALQESNAGRWRVNVGDPSAGLYHVTLDKALKHLSWDDTPFNRNRAAQRLIDDHELAAELAVNELLFWKDRSSGKWLDTWASYNTGHIGLDSDRGVNYANNIRDLIGKIQQCGWIQ